MATLPSNDAFSAFRGLGHRMSGFWNGEARNRSWAVAKEVASGMNLRSSGFALHAGLGAAGGGAAGYLYGGDGESAVKGAGLGVLGVTGWRGIQSARSSPLVNKEIGAGKTAWGNFLMQGRLGAMEVQNPSARFATQRAVGAAAGSAKRMSVAEERALYRSTEGRAAARAAYGS